MRDVAEVRAAERAYINSWNRVELPITAVVLGVVMTVLFAGFALEDADAWLFVLAALSSLVAVWGMCYLRRLGPAPMKQQRFRPE